MSASKQLLIKAVFRRMGQLNKIGTSKKSAREQYNKQLHAQAPNSKTLWKQSPYIHSISTLKQYTEICVRYATYLAEKYPNVKKLSYAHKMAYDREYIQLAIDNQMSAWTINRTCAALAKLHGCSMPEVHNYRPTRQRAHITRSRWYSEQAFDKDVNKYGDIAEICRYIGVRQCELKTIKPVDFCLLQSGNLYLHLDGKTNNTKGGKSRDVEILPHHQARVLQIIRKYNKTEAMFPFVPKRLSVHAIRALYAQDFYNDISIDVTHLKSQRIIDHKGRNVSAVYQCRDKTNTSRIYDRAALIRVSKSLGHNRACVISSHYLK